LKKVFEIDGGKIVIGMASDWLARASRNRVVLPLGAKTLAALLRTNYLPKVYIIDDDILRFRDLARHKANTKKGEKRKKEGNSKQFVDIYLQRALIVFILRPRHMCIPLQNLVR